MDNEPKFETTEPKKLTEDQKVWAQKKAKYDHIKIEAIKKRFKAEIAKLSILKPYNRVYWSMHYMKGSFTTDLMNYNMSWEIWEMLMRGVKEYVVDEQLWARDLAEREQHRAIRRKLMADEKMEILKVVNPAEHSRIMQKDKKQRRQARKRDERLEVAKKMDFEKFKAKSEYEAFGAYFNSNNVQYYIAQWPDGRQYRVYQWTKDEIKRMDKKGIILDIWGRRIQKQYDEEEGFIEVLMDEEYFDDGEDWEGEEGHGEVKE